MRFLQLRWLGVLLVSMVGCGTGAERADHTHLWTSNDQHVWSYEIVTVLTDSNGEESKPGTFLTRELLADESLTLLGGAVVSFDGEKLFVGKQVVDVKNVQVERSGFVRRNAYIRSSD